MRAGPAALAALAAAGCFFAPQYPDYPRCDREACPTGFRCVAADRVCVPECGEACPDGGGENVLAVSPAVLAPARVCTAYAQSFAATGGTPPYRFTLASGSPPPGVALEGTGALAGTPSAAGTFPFVVRAEDASTPARWGAVSAAVEVRPGSLTVVNNALPAARLGTPYTQKLNAVGGAQPYAWALCAGELPSGIALVASGDLAGTATAAGSYGFTLAARDAVGEVGAKSLSLVVNP